MPTFHPAPAGHMVNPAVSEAADLFTDGAVTGAVLASVAAMRGLPLYIERTIPQPPTPTDRALAALASAERALDRAERDYVVAVSRIRAANKAAGRNPSGFLRALAADQRADAFRALNRARVAIRRAERALIDARVALDCARIADLLPLAA